MTTLTGRLLRIDLSKCTHQVEEIPQAGYEKFITARGLSSFYLYKELAPNIDPLQPENKLIMSIGVLGGTGLQGFSKWAVSSKSPLTGTIFRSITGGNFGVYLKYAGYDLLIVEGRAEKPMTVHLDEDGAHFLPAEDLWGLDYRQTQKHLKAKHGARTVSACIGMAGEKLVRYAVISSGERTAARGGMGTVMGSKNLKAISINVPSQMATPFDKTTFKQLLQNQIQTLKAHPRRKTMSTLGTAYITTIVDTLGILPVKNFQEGRIETVEQISGDAFYGLKKAKAGCHVCMTRCGGMREVRQGPLRGSQIDGPEYETIFAFGPLLGLTDKQFVIDANALCDYYGIDTISTGVCVAYACELTEKGILSAADTDGLELKWGHPPALFAFIEKIARREGIGDLLAEGVKRAAQQLGGKAADFAMHIKGLELPGYDPRGVKGYALSMATSNIGGSHMYGRPREEFSGKADPLAESEKGALIARVQKEQAVEDSLIACTFGNTGLDQALYSQMLLAATGLKAYAGADNLLKIGERIVCIERCFNVRDGFGRKDDWLPQRMMSQPLRKAGPAAGQVVKDLDTLLNEYYDALGYAQDGIPTFDKIRDLDLETIVNPSALLKS